MLSAGRRARGRGCASSRAVNAAGACACVAGNTANRGCRRTLLPLLSRVAGFYQVHDFDFWRLEPVRWRFIGGFGAIHWLDQVALGNPFAGEAELSMVEHMNSDHASALAHYVELAGLPTHTPAQLVGIDAEGFHLRIGQSLYWLNFPTSCNSPLDVRQALVSLARAVVWPTDGQASA